MLNKLKRLKMGIGQEEATPAFTYVILLLSASVVASAPDTLHYTCTETGINEIQCVDCNHFAIITGDVTKRTYCKGQGTELLSLCVDAQNKTSLLVLYEEVTTKKLIGGRLPIHYQLKCIDDGSIVSHNTTVFTATPVTTAQHNQSENIIHGFTLGLVKDHKALDGNTVIHIGDTLTLQMKGTGVVIDPMSCSAYSKVNSHEKVVLWEKDNQVCKNKEDAIISSKKWSHIGGDPSGISIDIFAFRFTTDAEVVIGCTALVCSVKAPTKCKQTCVEAIPTQNPTPKPSTIKPNRKRRGIVIVRKDDSRRIRSSSISFSVSDNESLDNSSPGLSIGNVQFLTLGLVLLFVILPKY